jgi:hypothetical protein
MRYNKSDLGVSSEYFATDKKQNAKNVAVHNMKAHRASRGTALLVNLGA